MLEAEGLAVGTVTGIAAQLRYRIVVTGTAGHAGTSSMPLRRDALPGAAEMVLAVEAIARADASDLVATVGKMEVLPGAANVIPGEVRFTVDVRSGRRRPPQSRRRCHCRAAGRYRRAARTGFRGRPHPRSARQPLRSAPHGPYGRGPWPTPVRRPSASFPARGMTRWSWPRSAPLPCCSSAAPGASVITRPRRSIPPTRRSPCKSCSAS